MRYRQSIHSYRPHITKYWLAESWGPLLAMTAFGGLLALAFFYGGSAQLEARSQGNYRTNLTQR